jgi:hypothetical protein
MFLRKYLLYSLICDMLQELLNFRIVCLYNETMLFSNEALSCNFIDVNIIQESLSDQFDMVDVCGDFYLKIGNQIIFSIANKIFYDFYNNNNYIR